MLSISVSNVVHQIVQHELLHKGRKDEALYFNFDCRMSYHMDSKSYDKSRGLHLLYYSSPFSSLISVFSATTLSPFGTINDVSEWKHESTHDTCWRDIHTFSDVYFEMAACINAALRSDNHMPVAPKDMHEWNNFGRNGLYEWVPVTLSPDPMYTHRKQIKVNSVSRP